MNLTCLKSGIWQAELRVPKDTVQQILIDSFHAVAQGKFSSHTPKMTWSEK